MEILYTSGMSTLVKQKRADDDASFGTKPHSIYSLTVSEIFNVECSASCGNQLRFLPRDAL